MDLSLGSVAEASSLGNSDAHKLPSLYLPPLLLLLYKNSQQSNLSKDARAQTAF